MPETAWSPGFLLTCELFLNGRFLAIAAPPDGNVEYQWRPHRVVRTNGEAFKSSEDAPFIEDWCCIQPAPSPNALSTRFSARSSRYRTESELTRMSPTLILRLV
ncbi:MAG: hypothetical protein WBD45_06985 [Terriglobales bacterium]